MTSIFKPVKYEDKYSNTRYKKMMTRSRGRPARPIPVHPERVISRAIKAGLSATIELQRNISSSITKKYYESSYSTWSIRQQVYQITKKRGAPDFSHIAKAEASIRNNTRQMFFENAAKYGFVETHRQKSADDRVDPLNQRFNACGAVVRENSEIMFPFPEPTNFGTHTRQHGNARKKYRRAGFEESSFGPRVILAHPDLPSLDFGDAIRSHNEYLATFCVIHDVPLRETTRYSNLFFLLARPYLEYLYSESKCGNANFQKGVNRALRQVKELILATGYQPTMYVKRTVTKELEFEESRNEEENKTFFMKSEEDAREFYGDHPAAAELRRLRGCKDDIGNSTDAQVARDDNSKEDDDAIFTERDVKHIRNKAAKRARVAGSIMHRRIADLFPSPWHLNDVILSGDRYSRSSDYIIISEVPVQTQQGAGKVDLILCERIITEDGKRVFWKPVFVIEIKTRLGQSWYINANYKESEVRPDGSPLQRVVSDFPLSNYPLNDNLWEAIVKSTPTPSARRQLDIYCEALTELYENTTQQELGRVLRGVVVVDSASDVSEIRRVLERLVASAYRSVESRTRGMKRTVFTPCEMDSSRIALVVDEQPGLRRKKNEIVLVPWGPVYTPFKTQKKTKRKFLLYLTGHSPTSAGQSAAWNARYYHGLQMLYEFDKTQDNTKIIWVDLASQFNEPLLTEARLRLRPSGYTQEEMVKVQPDYIREFFEKIEVRGYLDGILAFLYHDGDLPSFDLRGSTSEKSIIIITGADTLLDATPSSHRERFSVLIDHLLSRLPDNDRTAIVWFDTPAPSVEKAIPYSTRALFPYHETSSLSQVVTEIIWNLPIAPRGAVQPDKWSLPTIGDSPMHDDIRVVISHTSSNLRMELIHVPLLTRWSNRFRNKGSGIIIREQEIEEIVPDKILRNRIRLLSLTMIPWLVKLWPQATLMDDSAETLEEQFDRLDKEYRGGNDQLTIMSEVLAESVRNPPSLLDLIKFRLPENMDALSFQIMTAGKINSQRLYRSERKLQTQPLQGVPAPQLKQDLPIIEEGLQHHWLFGVKLKSEGDDSRPWWMVVQDPTRPSRMLVGCFIDRPPDKDGFLWAESRYETLTQSSLDEILGFSQIIMIGRKTGEGLELWSSCDGEEAVYAGVLELTGQCRSTTGHLRAIRQTITEEPRIRPSSNTQPSESFYTRMVDSLRKQHAAVTSPTPVRVCLEAVEDACRVILKDGDDDLIQDITVEYTADLISLLRWPTANGGPMFTDSGKYVIWSIFDDIDYAELDFISPYVTYTAARTAPEELPKRISQFFDEAETLSVSIEHDPSNCPIMLGIGVGHEACWRITLPDSCPAQVRRILERALTGEEVNGLLAPGRFYAGKLYMFDIIIPSVSEKDESIVFHEERYIRMFLRNQGLPLKQLPPGTFLHTVNQQWIVSVDWDGNFFKWQAQSTVSALFFKGNHQIIELTHGHGAQEECERLLSIITSQISVAYILNYPELKEHVLAGLRNRGYSKSSPVCELRIIEQSASTCRFGVFLCEGSQRTPFLEYTIEAIRGVKSDALLEEIMVGLEEGDMSAYNIRNTEVFFQKISAWVDKHISSNQ
jgi:hypothetical protein